MVRVSEDGRAEIRKLEPLHQHHILLPYFSASYTTQFSSWKNVKRWLKNLWFIAWVMSWKTTSESSALLRYDQVEQDFFFFIQSQLWKSQQETRLHWDTPSQDSEIEDGFESPGAEAGKGVRRCLLWRQNDYFCMGYDMDIIWIYYGYDIDMTWAIEGLGVPGRSSPFHYRFLPGVG